MAAPEPDYDLDEFRPPEPDWTKGLEKKLPSLPLLGLPIVIPGLPILPDYGSMIFWTDARTPGFIKDAADDLKYDGLFKLVVETGLDKMLDVDLDLDLTVKEVASAIRKAAGDLDASAAGTIAGKLVKALDVDLGDLVKPPKLGLLGLPIVIPGLPILPDYGSMFFWCGAKTPKFIKDMREDVQYDALYKLVVETGLDKVLDVDLDLDLTVKEVASAIRKAAGDLNAGAAGKIASALTKALDADLSDFVKPPKLGLLGLPIVIPGLPILPNYAAMVFPMDSGDPLEHLASWLKE